MSISKRKPNGNSDSEVAQLLGPQIRFLRAAGVTLEEINQIVRAEFRKRLPRQESQRIEHVPVAMVNHCGTLIANWKTHPDFLNKNGYPRDLAIRGRNGFMRLAAASAPEAKPHRLLKILQRFGATRRLPSGRVRLTTKVFNCTHADGRLIAFEPSLAFLVDAARVIDDQLGTRRSPQRKPTRYWREVENANVPGRLAPAFLAFSKRRVMVLMEEIEDWLDQHKLIEPPRSRQEVNAPGPWPVCHCGKVFANGG